MDISIFKFDSVVFDNIFILMYGKYNVLKEVLDVFKLVGFNFVVFLLLYIFDGKMEGL